LAFLPHFPTCGTDTVGDRKISNKSKKRPEEEQLEEGKSLKARELPHDWM
jgi:hypothetical protein